MQVIFALFLAAAAALPNPGEVINVNLSDQKHNQQGEAGNAVTGSYR